MEALSEWLAAADGRAPSILVAVLLFVRVLPVIVWTPLFGGARTPARLRIGVALVTTLALLPVALPHAELPAAELLANGGVLAVACARELWLGACSAVVVRVVFEMAAAPGAFVDVARGATMANVMDPLTQQQTSVLNGFLRSLVVAVFLTLGGYRIVLRGLAAHLAAVPVGGTTIDGPFAPATAVAALATLLAEMTTLAFQLAAPVVAVLFLTDLALGLVSRAAPQIQAFFLGITIKPWLALAVLLLTSATFAPVIFERIESVLFGWWFWR